MKHLISLQQDYIISTRFVANMTEERDKAGRLLPQYADESKKQQVGKHFVESVECLVEQIDQYGNSSQTFKKVWILKDDIHKLSQSINEIEKQEVFGNEKQDLPF